MGGVQEISTPDSPLSRFVLIRAELEQILSSSVFVRADRLSGFLRFIVENELGNHPEPLKETLIGVQVYAREPDYDPKTEPIVRTEARRLRHKLEEYYAGPGVNDRVVITVPTGGYAPHFEIRPEAAPRVVTLPQQQPPPSRPGLASRAAIRWILLGLVCGVCFVVLWKWLAHTQPPVSLEVPVTRLPGLEFQPSLSPDGKSVAFVWSGPGHDYDIYVKKLDDGSVRRLTRGSAYDVFPSWSPDGRNIAFLRLFPDGTKHIVIVPASGGKERLLCTTNAAQPAWVDDPSVLSFSPGPAWSADGKFLAISDRSNDKEPDTLYFVSVSSGQKKRAVTPEPREVGDYDPAFSADGKTLAFVRVGNYRRTSDIFVYNLAGGSVKRITSDSKIIKGLTWATARRLVFSSNRAGNRLLWTVSSRGGMPEQLLGAGQNVSYPSASVDGRALVYAERFRNTDVWRVPLKTAGGEQKTAVRLIASSTTNDSAQYSPDGKKIAFISDRSGAAAIWICNADGSDPVSLFSENSSPVGTPRWSPDGRQIVFDMVKDGHSAIAVVEVKTGAVRVVAAGPSDYMMPSWSRDGRFIYYVLPTGSAQVQVWKKPLAEGGAFQVTYQGGGEASESPDGTVLYYLKGRAGVWHAPSFGGTESPAPGLENVVTSRHFFVARTGIYFLASEQPPWKIEYRAFSNGKISDVATIERTPEFQTPSLSVSPDERWLIYTQLDQSGEDIMMVKGSGN
jgi:Tol biopolymer transport system component